MQLVNFSKDVISEDDLSYSLDNKVEPNLYNAGNTVAFIHGVAIKPGENFMAGVSGAKMKGKLQITFDDNAVDTSLAATKKIVCFYGFAIKTNQDCV